MKKLIPVMLGATLVSTMISGNADASLKKPNLEFVKKVSNTTGFLNVNADQEGTVYVYNGNKKVTMAKTDYSGYIIVAIPPQKTGSVLRIYSIAKNGQKSPELKLTVTGNFKVKKQLAKKKYSLIEKNEINQKFTQWAALKAKNTKKAYNSIYTDYVKNSAGDWFGVTPHGYIQSQDMNTPGYYGYGIHAIGGGVFYTPKDNQFGYSNDLHDETTTNGYVSVAKPKTTVTKYILGDNGVVYELKKKTEAMNYMTGFAGRSKTGDSIVSKLGKGNQLVVSQDKAAQAKFKAILKQYQ